jgi:hypothetical protein
MEKQITVEQFVQEWMNGHEEGTFIKNQHGQAIYSAGPSSLNLTAFFEILLEDYIEAQQAISKAEDKGDAERMQYYQNARETFSNAVSNLDIQTRTACDSFILAFDHLLNCSKQQLTNSLYVKETLTDQVFKVWKYIESNDGEVSVWCNDWYGRHVIGQDCEFSLPPKP